MTMPFKLDTIHPIDALEGLRKLPDRSIDLVVTDPPYNIASTGKTTIRAGKIISTMEAFGEWDRFDPFDYDLFIQEVISQCFRVLVNGGSLYMFTSRENNGYFIRKAVARGFTYRNQLVMVKKNPIPSWAKSNWRSAFETCLYVTKGKARTFNFLSQHQCVNVYCYAIGRKVTTHPTEKPYPFIHRIVEVSSNAGELVLDPFMGSGTTADACVALGRRYLGFETKLEYIRMAETRLRRRAA